MGLMKKLFLWISIVALVIIFAAAALALLSVFNLLPFFTEYTLLPDKRLEKDQIIILVATSDTLQNQKSTVQKAWLMYYVLSRHDTMMVDALGEQELVSMEINQPIGQQQLVRAIEKAEQIQIDYYFLLDEKATQSIRNLYAPTQNSIDTVFENHVCETLLGIDGNSLITAIDLAGNHIKTNMSNSLLTEIVDNKDRLLCNYMD